MSDGADLYRVQMGIPIGFFASDSCLEASVWISAIRLSDVSGFFDVIAGFLGSIQILPMKMHVCLWLYRTNYIK